jgi:hydroxymethylpyrimidine/phosphomethylpyrimidine kinase
VTAVLVIAGTDSSGGAGLTRDVATLTHFGVEALCAVTAVTVQTDARVEAVELMPPTLVRAQIAAALGTGRVRAIKIGMLGARATVEAVAAAIQASAAVPVVLDPVLAATSGGGLLDAGGRAALRELLLARATLLTPNIPEAAALLGEPAASREEQLIAQARALCALGAAAVLLKGGHAGGPLAIDFLVSGESGVRRFAMPRSGARRRGTGCALAAGIAAGLAANMELGAACERAKRYVTELLQHGS